jgi:hypothetical protein
MHPWIRTLVAVFLALCLPLQGVAGITMPACSDQEAPALMSQGEAMPDSAHCMHGDEQERGGKTMQAKCFACHLVISQAIAPRSLPVAQEGISAVYFESAAGKYRTRLSVPFHPPKPVSALG